MTNLPQKFKKVENVEFQYCSSETDAFIVEFLNEEHLPFMDISAGEDGILEILLYRSSESILLPASEIIKGIEIAQNYLKERKKQRDRHNKS